MFYNHLILSGTKIKYLTKIIKKEFYNHLILSGTKIRFSFPVAWAAFYNHLILSGTKIITGAIAVYMCFTIT